MWEEYEQQMHIVDRKVAQYLAKKQSQGISINDCLRSIKYEWLRNIILKKILSHVKKWGNFLKQEYEDWFDYTRLINLKQNGLDQGLIYLQEPVESYWAKLPLEDQILKLQVPVLFYYGEQDWIDKETGIKLVEKFYDLGIYSKAIIVPHSTHSMHFDNPKFLTSSIFIETAKVSRALA